MSKKNSPAPGPGQIMHASKLPKMPMPGMPKMPMGANPAMKGRGKPRGRGR